MPIVGVNHRLLIFHMSKIMVHFYTTGKNINKISIGYMINPSLKFNNTLGTQVETLLNVSFYIRTMKTIKYGLMKKNTCVMALLIIYENWRNTKTILLTFKLCCL